MVLLLALLAAFSQPSGFSGTWVAEHQSTIYVRLEVTNANAAFHGALGTGNIKVGPDGTVIDATPAPQTLTKLTTAGLKGDELRITRPEGSVMEDFGVRLVGADRAELIFYAPPDVLEELKAEGIPLPKPIPLRRVR